MQKSIRNIALLILLVAVGYSFYAYFHREVRPNSLRKFYKQQDVSKIIKVEVNTGVEEKKTDEVQRAQINNDKGMTEEKVADILKGSFESLKNADRECKNTTEKLLKDQDIIDPRAGLFKSNEEVISVLSDVLGKITGRASVSSVMAMMIDVYSEVDSISTETFFNNLNGLMICRKNRLPIFLDTVVEAFDEKRFNESEVEIIRSTLIKTSELALQTDRLSDNLLYSLNLIRVAASLSKDSKLRDALLSELDGVYGRIAQFEDNFYDFGNDKSIRNPVSKLDEYTKELDYIAEEVSGITKKYFPEYQN
ncbi:hypothetical protein [Bacteriovorax sp. Seq25_V]|uniref:hypothetical protein n=1 Tax=Bacteriovorax sp. Seq25_V TaxID=1201288 RepID=UPI000389F7CA|nr:hypothetical protein [Bacteriovorax sp. Seq25_V]EQC46636.1 hypothetical protein M900_2347 [Bacteriovorax sp. Seq25_V]